MFNSKVIKLLRIWEFYLNITNTFDSQNTNIDPKSNQITISLSFLNGSLDIPVAYLAVKWFLGLKYNMHVSKIKEGNKFI